MYYTVSANTPGSGGCRQLVNYLDKEPSLSEQFAEYLDKESEIHGQDFFFNGGNNRIEKDEVISGINKNCKGLKQNESRFFSLTFNPSLREIRHIERFAQAQIDEMKRYNITSLVIENEKQIKDAIVRDMLRQYAVLAMDKYALNFGREGINSNRDLVWFGRVERDRYWKYSSKEVQHNKRLDSQIKQLYKEAPSKDRNHRIAELKRKYILESDVRKGGKDVPIQEMMPKSGDNYHIHVIVSRKDKSQTKSLSPLANARQSNKHVIQGRECKIGFDRDNYANMIETAFDSSFEYKRFFYESYEGRKTMKQTPELYKAKEAEYNVLHNINPRTARQVEKNELVEKGQPQQTAEMVANSVAQQAGMNYINEGARPYVQAVKLGRKSVKILRSHQKTKAAADLAKAGKAISQAAKIGKAANPYSLVADAAVSLAKGFARGL